MQRFRSLHRSSKAKACARDADLMLRHITRALPEHLAKAVLPRGAELRQWQWKETQVTARQRRLDRALLVQAGEHQRLLHWEWERRWRGDIRFRVFEYHVLLALALMDESKAGERPPSIESMVVLLDGRRSPPLPEEGVYRTSPLDQAFSGVQFRIEAVYLRTVDELLERDNAFWLIFSPLAVDATPEKMVRVLDVLRTRANEKVYKEVALAMLVMARNDHRKRDLDKSIRSALHEQGEVVMDNWVYKQGFRAGVKSGVAKGIERGRIETAREALKQVLSRRGLKLSLPQKARIDECSDLGTLKLWLSKAIVAPSTAAVFGGVKSQSIRSPAAATNS